MATIPIKNPKWGDSQLTLLGAVIRHTAGGDLKVFRSTTWEKATRFRLEFEAVTQEDAGVFAAFVVANRGKVVQYVDPLSVSHDCLVISETVETVQVGHCNFQTSIELEVV